MIPLLITAVFVILIGGCIFAYFTFGKIEKDTEKKVEELVEKEIKYERH